MKEIEINYQDLQGLDPAYIEKLKTRESAIRQAMKEMGHHDAPVRWSYIDDGAHNYVFRLFGSEGENDCILQISPLDLTLKTEEFERLLVEGKRACVSIPK